MRSLKQTFPKVKLDRERKIDIAVALFPEMEKTAWAIGENVAPPLDVLIAGELTKACERLKMNRAPGPDGVIPEVIKAVVKQQGDAVLGMLNVLLADGRFPEEWKRAVLVLIPKSGRDQRDANGFPPICLMDTMGKLYETLILQRLEQEVEITGRLNAAQFGFPKGRSAIGAIHEARRLIKRAGANKWRALILLDVKNAFNTANWQLIIGKLLRRGVNNKLVHLLCQYFSDRSLQVWSGHVREINVEVPQGPILRPVLWNILYDYVLSLTISSDTSLIEYAVDLAVGVSDDTEMRLVQKGNVSINMVYRWMREHAFALVFSMRKIEGLGFQLRGMAIEHKNKAKYLGVVFDRHLTFGSYISEICNKAERTAAAVSRLMPNIGGPTSK